VKDRSRVGGLLNFKNSKDIILNQFFFSFGFFSEVTNSSIIFNSCSLNQSNNLHWRYLKAFLEFYKVSDFIGYVSYSNFETLFFDLDDFFGMGDLSSNINNVSIDHLLTNLCMENFYSFNEYFIQFCDAFFVDSGYLDLSVHLHYLVSSDFRFDENLLNWGEDRDSKLYLEKLRVAVRDARFASYSGSSIEDIKINFYKKLIPYLSESELVELISEDIVSTFIGPDVVKGSDSGVSMEKLTDVGFLDDVAAVKYMISKLELLKARAEAKAVARAAYRAAISSAADLHFYRYTREVKLDSVSKKHNNIEAVHDFLNSDYNYDIWSPGFSDLFDGSTNYDAAFSHFSRKNRPSMLVFGDVGGFQLEFHHIYRPHLHEVNYNLLNINPIDIVGDSFLGGAPVQLHRGALELFNNFGVGFIHEGVSSTLWRNMSDLTVIFPSLEYMRERQAGRGHRSFNQHFRSLCYRPVENFSFQGSMVESSTKSVNPIPVMQAVRN